MEEDELRKRLLESYIDLENLFGQESHEMEYVHSIVKAHFPNIIFDSLRIKSK